MPVADVPPTPVRPRHPLTLLGFFVGAALATVFLDSMFHWWTVVAAAALFTLASLGVSYASSHRRALRWLGRLAWVVLFLGYVLWTYLAVAFGALLAWTVPGWAWVVVTAVALLTVVTWVRPLRGVRLPAVLPLGIWVAVALSGWTREEDLLRCDDFRMLSAPVELVVPSHPDLDQCRPGEVRPAGRFPRTFWEAPDGRVVFTTQGHMRAGGIDGAVCEARLDDGNGLRCVGEPIGKSQGLLEDPDRDSLLVFEWGSVGPGGQTGSILYELTRQDPLEIRAAHRFHDPLGDGFYEPRISTLYAFSDRMDGIHPLRAPSFDSGPIIPMRFAPGEVRYDQERRRGVACGGHLGAALRGDPFELRAFVGGDSPWIDQLSVTWGCDWDPSTGRVFTTVPNLGLLAEIDYDTGRVSRRWFVGPGMRSVAYDAARRRVYFTDFLRGYVLAFDERTESVVDRWFVGRFSRYVRVTRDGSALLATSNLGIVRIPLSRRGAP